MKKLIPFLKEEMKSCPSQEFVFNLIETVDYYALKRFFNLKINTSSNNKSLSQFKETLCKYFKFRFIYTYSKKEFIFF